jgi:hypothetical protein
MTLTLADPAFLGRSQGWTPAALGSALALWLDADDASTITLNGSTVSQWNDKSGNGRHATQATAANQPIYVSGGINGVNSVSFAGNDSLAASPIFAAANDATVIIVLQYNSLNATQSIYSTEASVGGTPAMYLQANAGTLRVYGGSYVDDGTYTVGQVEVNAFSRGASTGNLWRNGMQVLENAAIGSLTKNAGFLMGRLTNGLYGVFEMGEVVALDGQASTANRQRLEGYLAWKWGLEANLPSNHPYKNTPPTV